MLQFLHKPPLELYECFGAELRRAYKEYYLFEATITDAIYNMLNVKEKDRVKAWFHSLMLTYRHDYVNDLSGYLSYVKTMMVISSDYRERKSFDKIEGMKTDESVIYAYNMGV